MKFKLFPILTLLFVSFICSNAKAYSLNDAVVAVLQNNEKIKAAKKKLEIEILKKPKVMTEFLPSVSAELNQTFHENRNFNDSSKPMKYHQGSLIWSVEQEIYSGGSTIAKMLAADAEINIAYQEYASTLNEVIYQIIQIYQNILTTRELFRTQAQNVEMTSKHVEKAAIAVKSGAETKTSLHYAKANFADMKSRLEDYKVQQKEAEAYFQAYVGEVAPEKMELIDLKKHKVPTLEAFKVLVSQKNPDILKAKNTLKASRHGISIATAELMPKIALFGKAVRQDGPSFYKGDNMFNGRQIRQDGNTYGVKMSIPVFSKGLGYINISEARKKEKLSAHNLKNALNTIQATITDTWEHYISSDSIYHLSCKAEENYHQTYLSMQAEFDVGARTIINVIEKQKEYNFHTLERLGKEQKRVMALFKIYQTIGNLHQVILTNR